MRAGLLVNPRAGRAKELVAPVMRYLSNWEPMPGHGSAGDWDWVAAPSVLGGDHLGLAGLSPENVLDVPFTGTREDSIRAVSSMAEHGVEIVVVLGGDGTLSDAAFGLFLAAAAPDRTCLLGIGCGTTNAGSLISVKGEDFRSGYYRRHRLRPAALSGLLVSLSERGSPVHPVALALNDCCVANTTLATLDGATRDVDCMAMLEGKLTPAAPRPLNMITARVEVLHPDDPVPRVLATGTEIGQVVVGLVDRRFKGKAVAGGVCLTSFAGLPGAVIVSDSPLVRGELDPILLRDCEPVTSKLVSLRSGSTVTLEGMAEGSALCADGTPIAALTPDRHVSVRIEEQAVWAMKAEGDHDHEGRRLPRSGPARDRGVANTRTRTR